jgi:hypothetical protein
VRCSSRWLPSISDRIFDRLAGLAKEQAVPSVRSGALFVFLGKRKTALKVFLFR